MKDKSQDIEAQKTETPDAEKKQMLFFCATTPYVMIYKIAREFNKRGYETVLATFSRKETWEESWYEDGFDKIICSNFQLSKPNPKNIFDMFKRLPYLFKSIIQMHKLKPHIVFAVARPNLITAFAMRFFKRFPLIYFPYDVSAQQHPDLQSALQKGLKQYEINAERYCFENADGIMHKGAPEELDFLKEETMLGENLKITPLRINFQPYCTDEFIIPLNKSKLSKKDKEFHLAYVGGLYVSKDALKSYVEIMKKIMAQKIHIHVFLKTQHLSKEEDMKNLSPLVNSLSSNKYFHIEYAVDPRKLVSEISKFDFGIEFANFGPVEINYPRHAKFLAGNKISSFFEAGFSFFCNKRFDFESKVPKKYGIDLALDPMYDFKDFNERLKKIDYKKLEKNILKARKDFNMTKHIPRLEDFIEKVVKHHKNKKPVKQG